MNKSPWKLMDYVVTIFIFLGILLLGWIEWVYL